MVGAPVREMRDGLADGVLEQLEAYEAAKAGLQRARDRYAAAGFAAARALADLMPVRDVAILMKITQQRVYQLLQERRR